MIAVTNFLITQIIWSVTVGSYHIPFSFLLLFLLLKLWDHLSWIKAFWLSFILVIGAFVIFCALVGGILVWGFKVAYVLPDDTYQGTYSHLHTSLFLGLIYTAIQVILVMILRRWTPLNIWRIFLSLLCANIMSALLVYKMSFAL